MNTIGEENCINLNDDSNCNNVDGNSNDGIENNEANKDDIDEGYKRIIKLIVNEIWGLEFGFESKACEFY